MSDRDSLSLCRRPERCFLFAVLTGCALSFAGCGGGTATPAPEETAVTDEHVHDGEVEAALAQLAPEDRALAEAQKVCAVSGEPLGSMGKPIVVEHQGKKVLLCCEGCRGAFEADPETYVAKVEEGGSASGAGDAQPADGADAGRDE